MNTRIKKLEEEGFDGIVLAEAGVTRLGLDNLISLTLDEKECLYAPA